MLHELGNLVQMGQFGVNGIIYRLISEAEIVLDTGHRLVDESIEIQLD